MKKQIPLLMTLILLLTNSFYSGAQWSLTGNAGTNSTNFLGTTDAQPMRFKTNAADRMIIDASGKVGMGVTSPKYKLDVSSSVLLRIINAKNTASSTSSTYGIYSLNSNAGTGSSFGVYGSGAGAGGTNYGLYGAASEGATNYGVYGTVTSSVNAPVGIGTYGISNGTGTTNYGLMGSAGGAGTTNYGVYGTATGGATNWAGYFLQNCYIGGSVGIGVSTLTDSKFIVQQSGTTSTTAKFLNNSKGPNVSWVHFGTNGDWYIRSAANAGKVILQDQNASSTVCIGTSLSATGYKLSVGGKIICEELKVLLTANWPDYVFAKDYELMSLNNLQNFIEENKHLPGIPSAAEMEKDGGIAIGEMQTLLVKKLEEANLYILQLNKRIEELEAKSNK